MSKISGDDLEIAIQNIYARKNLKSYKYKGVETVDLQIKLRNYTPKDPRFSGSVKLQYETRKNVKVCILGNKKDYDEAVSKKYEAMSVEDMEKAYKSKDKKLKNKKVKKLAEKYTGFVASASLISKIPRILGPGLSKAGKFPAVMDQGDTIDDKVSEIAKTVKFQFKKEVCIGTAVGHLDLKPDQLKTNINTCINFLVSLLKKNWQNIGTITIKSNQGRPQTIFPPASVEVQDEAALTRRKALEKKKAQKERAQKKGEKKEEKPKAEPKAEAKTEAKTEKPKAEGKTETKTDKPKAEAKSDSKTTGAKVQGKTKGK